MSTLPQSRANVVHFPVTPTIKAYKGSNRELAEAISTVLNHPNVPVSIYNAMVDEIGDLQGDWMNEYQNSADYLSVLLEHREAALCEENGDEVAA